MADREDTLGQVRILQGEVQRFGDPQAGRGQQQDDRVQGRRADRAGMPAGPVPQRERAGQQGTHLVPGVDVG